MWCDSCPLLQGLLDANPALSITLVTWRTYLYDNPRVTAVPDRRRRGAFKQALAGPLDGVVEFFQTGVPRRHLPDRGACGRRLLPRGTSSRHWSSRATSAAPIGARVGNRFSFLHQTVELDRPTSPGRAASTGVLVRNVYEPAMRLLAELGLPQRAAEEAARSRRRC